LRHKLFYKTSQMLALVMILSTLVPALSYAATLGITGATYDKVTGKVSATVYSDTYAAGPDEVFLNISGDNHSPWKSAGSATYATYSWYDNVTHATYFNFSYTVTSGVYNAVYLQAAYQGSVSDEVYVRDSHNYGNPGSCCTFGGGGGYGWPSDSDGSITVGADGSVNADDLAKAYQAAKSVVLKLNGDFALIPAAGLLDAVKLDGAMLKVVSDNGAYLLPLSVFKLDNLAKKLGIEVKDLKIKVTIAKVTGAAAAAVSSALNSLAGTSLANPVDFSVTAVGADGKTAEVDFGNTYVARQLKLTGDVDPSSTTGLVWDETRKTLSFVPGTFEKVDGTTVATLWRNSSSIYTVASFHKSFTDVKGHWAQSYVELLANKLVVDGVTDTTFEPDRSITRGEFAALVVRSLGLKTDVGAATSFSDVTSSDWYAGVVAAAAQAGIIDGYEDGTFRPDRQITREELAAMVVRAMNYVGQDTNVSTSEQASLLAKFTDADQIVWGQKELAAAVKAGIVDGMTDTTLGSNLQATRAQSAVMLKRFLSKAGWIN
jgi:N-acetylmuramoyl-L-alanine amidase